MSETERDYPFFVIADTHSHTFLESTEPRPVAHYEFSADGMTIYDPVWEKCLIGDQPGDELLLELVNNPLVRRTMSIEQLSLDKHIETIPGTAEFSRWEHIWGSVVFVRRMTEGLDINDREKLIMQLRALVSDLGHTAYSHVGDWMFQDDNSENKHDQELMQLLETSGISDILRKYDIQPQDVAFPNVVDWIERPLPELCVDRVDYGAREIQRWAELTVSLHYALKPEAFLVDEQGNLIMRDYRQARDFAAAYLLLPTEHWNEPVHRLQLMLQQEMIKRVLTSDETGLISSNIDAPDEYHPRDYMYSFDFDLTWVQLRSWDSFLSVTRLIMEDIGKSCRRNFVFQRREQLRSFFSDRQEEPKLPVPLERYGGYGNLPMIPPNVEMIRVDDPDEISDFKKRKDTLDLFLKPFKPRYIDPLFLDEKGIVSRLSDADESFKILLAQQKEINSRAYVARLHLNPETRALISDGMDENKLNWEAALRRPRMGKEQFVRMLAEVAFVSGNHRLISVDTVDAEALHRYQIY